MTMLREIAFATAAVTAGSVAQAADAGSGVSTAAQSGVVEKDIVEDDWQSGAGDSLRHERERLDPLRHPLWISFDRSRGH